MNRITVDIERPVPVALLADPLLGAVLISLFTDRRAETGDVYQGDARGWWRDALRTDGDRTGSRLWLGGREKNMPQTLTRYREWADQALEWLVTDGWAQRVLVVASAPRRNVLWLDVRIDARQLDLEITV